MTFPEIIPLLRRGAAACLPQWLVDSDRQRHLLMGTYGELIVVCRERGDDYYWMSTFTDDCGETKESEWMIDPTPGFTSEGLGIIDDLMEGQMGAMKRRGPKFSEVSGRMSLPASGEPVLGIRLEVHLPEGRP